MKLAWHKLRGRPWCQTEVSNIPWRLHELSLALESCRNPDGERQEEKKEIPKKISVTSPFRQLRCHSNPKLQRPLRLPERKSGRSAHGVHRSVPLCHQSASSHPNGRSSHPRGDSDRCSHRSARPDYHTHREGNIMRD